MVEGVPTKVRQRKRSSPRGLSPRTPTLSHHVAALHQALLPAVSPGICKALSS